MSEGKVTTLSLRKMKSDGEKITMLTAYDYATALVVDSAGVDVLLVGDSLGMVIMGDDDTLSVTLDDMCHHTRAVARGVERALVVADMPFLSFQVSTVEAVRSAGRLVSESGAEAVKLEGGREFRAEVEAIVRAGIPVMGHLGLTPQSVHQLGGFRVQGKTEAAARKMMDDAVALQEAGVFSIVLECVPAPIAKLVTEKVDVPTIGIGAGPDVDGQVLVIHDMLGLLDRLRPSFVKRYAELAKEARSAVKTYVEEVRKGDFPSEEYTYGIDEAELRKLYGGRSE